LKSKFIWLWVFFGACAEIGIDATPIATEPEQYDAIFEAN
jgi:hypothetical protein